MRSARRFFGAGIVAAVAIGTPAGPASAHEREFDWVYAASTSDSEIKAQAALAGGTHPGKMKMTLKKKVDGKWAFVAAKTATVGDDGYYTAVFSMLGDEKCKVFAKHTANGHPPIKKAGNSFDC